MVYTLSLSMASFSEYCEQLAVHLKCVYGVDVVIRHLRAPFLGDLDGSEIHIDQSTAPEQRLFLMAHLFGHTVQWNVNHKAQELGRLHCPPVGQDLLPGIVQYEWEAARFGLKALHQAGISHLDQWFSDHSAADVAYLAHYYRTGDKLDFQSFSKANCPLIEETPIPQFTPTKKAFRAEGLVI